MNMIFASKMAIFIWTAIRMHQDLWLFYLTVEFANQAQAADPDPFIQSESRFLKFTYGDDDVLGPKYWVNLEDGLDTTNACDDIWRSPLNINISLATAHERIKFQEDFAEEDFEKSIVFNFNIDLDLKQWPIGYPFDTFHGIAVHPPNAAAFQLLDRFDPVIPKDEDVLFDFTFATVHYCDLAAHPTRTMHQLDGKRFPFEFDMFFFKDPLGLGVDKSLMQHNVGVVVAILGEISKEDNHRIEPLIRAAKRLHLPKEFDLDNIEFERKHVIKEIILPPWSPTWLIPDVSTYYYYNDGSFPVPPCYTIKRVYVIKESIKLSMRQWKILTNISSDRELNQKLECTFSLLQDDLDDVRYNSNEYTFRGHDGRPMSGEERKRVKARQQKDEADKMRQYQLKQGAKLSGINVQSSSVLLGLCYIYLLIIS